MKTIEQRSSDFESRVIAADGAPLQHDEMRIAFYAGFKAMLDVTFELAEFDQLSAVFLLEKFHNEPRCVGVPVAPRRTR